VRIAAYIGLAALAASLGAGGVATADANEDAYLQAVRTLPELSGFGDQWLLREGQLVCAQLRAGSSHAEVWTRVRDDANLPFSDNTDAILTGQAIRSFCPEQQLRGRNPMGDAT
jgi:hypothetical protein